MNKYNLKVGTLLQWVVSNDLYIIIDIDNDYKSTSYYSEHKNDVRNLTLYEWEEHIRSNRVRIVDNK